MSTGTMRRWRLTVPALCGAALLVLTGCGPKDDDVDAPEDPATQTQEQAESPQVDPEAEAEAEEPQAGEEHNRDSGLTAGEISAAVEPHGFECIEEEPVLSSRSEKVVCKGDDYAYITATKLVEESDMDSQLTRAKEALCGSDFTDDDDLFITAVSGAWVLVPGSDKDSHVALYDAAMTDLGLEWTQETCAG